MNIDVYKLSRCESDILWDSLIRQSDEYTIYTESVYLNSLINCRAAKWIIFKSQQPIACLCLIEDLIRNQSIENDMIVYSGIMYLPEIKRYNQAHTISEKFRIKSYCAAKLMEIYDEVYLPLSFNIIDVRPFMWFNYNSHGEKYHIDIKFTTIIELIDNKDIAYPVDVLMANMSKSRRQEITLAVKNNIHVSASDNINIFLDIYQKTFSRQNILVDHIKLHQIEKIIGSLLTHNMGKLYAATNIDGLIESMAFVGWDKHRAYYIFGANDTSRRKNGAGSLIIWHIMKELQLMGIRELDLEGINSPRRGHFKLSFGGKIKNYYHLKSSIR